MAGDDPTGVFDSITALEHRFKEITDLTAGAERQTDPGADDPAKGGKPQESGQKGAKDAAEQAADRPFNTLLWTDRRVKTVLAERRADEIGNGIA